MCFTPPNHMYIFLGQQFNKEVFAGDSCAAWALRRPGVSTDTFKAPLLASANGLRVATLGFVNNWSTLSWKLADHRATINSKYRFILNRVFISIFHSLGQSDRTDLSSRPLPLQWVTHVFFYSCPHIIHKWLVKVFTWFHQYLYKWCELSVFKL